MTLPLEAGSPDASPDSPLLGVMVTLDTRLMAELAIEMESVGATPHPRTGPSARGLALARWHEDFTGALLRLMQLLATPADAAILGSGRLRELYYAILKGEAGAAARQAFGVGNEIARSIQYLSSRLSEPITIEEMASHAGMSRAVFHRRFKQATAMSPLQFIKAMRLNKAAAQIAAGTPVNCAAWEVGYHSNSQFNREFKRLFGQSPGQWSLTRQAPVLIG